MQAKPRLAIVDIATDRQTLWSEATRSYVMDEIKVRRLINKLDKLLSTLPPSHSHRVIALHEKAYLYAYLMKRDVSRKYFDDAESEGLPLLAKCVSLSHALFVCGDLKGGAQEIMKVDREQVAQVDLVGVAACCVHLGLFKMAKDFYLQAGMGAEGISKKVVEAAQILDDIEAEDSDILERISVAGEIVKQMTNSPLIAYDLFAMQGEGILFRFVVRGGVDHLSKIDRAIDEALSSQFCEVIDNFFSIGIAPHAPDSVKSMGSLHVCM
ncbi:hypothetical protein [Pseudomonas viridiflava]|uniref:hypothetical protein n=3 Tax=Pseudomonas viridiflava TaxID=33069 RepID=UPI000F02E24C|nr:hypothetical protein [Pseudomonas viridiflava]